MGLCKCPRRKVTNLFCFEHRVNVCEFCLLANHESCDVQTYLSWLTDSDYDANCLLCFEPLNSKETVRLKCLHLFHWDCFDTRARQLPDTTAPAGYKCPSCLECIFPPENQQSPVIDKLRAKLHTVNWGRLGIGLESLPELDQQPSNAYLNSSVVKNSLIGSGAANHLPNEKSIASSMNNANDPFEMNTFTSRTKLLTESNGGSISSSVYIGGGNEDDSKYTKKAADRNLRQRYMRLPRPLKRLLFALFTLILLYALFYAFIDGTGGENGFNSGRGDPLFDPHANPNVRVQGGHGKGES